MTAISLNKALDELLDEHETGILDAIFVSEDDLLDYLADIKVNERKVENPMEFRGLPITVDPYLYPGLVRVKVTYSTVLPVMLHD